VGEVGAGIGTVSRSLLALPVERLVAFEPAPRLFQQLRRALAGEDRVELHHGTLPALAHSFESSLDAVVYVNVLEHIFDDHAELRAAAATLAPGGNLCLFVPAHPWLFTRLDAGKGHHRRYSARSLIRAVSEVGLEVVHTRSFDALGMITWLVAFKWLGLTMAPGSVRAYDRLVVPLARRLDGYLGHAFGKSLIVVARKPGSA
jgi:SAM-dependent methyltransferase